MSKSIVLLAPRRVNRFHHAEPRRLKEINTDILAGWFCCAVITVAAWAIVFWLVRWAWNHSATVLRFIGL